MGLAASQGRLLLLTAKRSDLEFRAQQISQKRLVLAQQLEDISRDYEDATSNRQMKIKLNPTNDSSNSSSVNQNLTYERLMSSTWNNPVTDIAKPDYVTSIDYAATQNYKLVDASGATVIADVSEIPKKITSQTTKRKISSDDDAVTTDANNDKVKYRRQYTQTAGQDKKYTGSAYYVATGELLNAINAKNGDTKKDAIDTESGIICYDGKYYNMETGALIKKDGTNDPATAEDLGEDNWNPTKNGKLSDGADVVLVANADDIEGTSTVTLELDGSEPKPKGNDGYYEVTFGTGANMRTVTYFVDKHLKNESTSEPGYLQECLRNSKYLIQVGKNQTDDNNEFKWNYVSWDATTAISDQYYTDDDETAKAKYDRLQAEIQNQDKKLELELDDIETQRNAVTTEIESVNKVIKDDIDGSFKTFNA